jgi:curved DNA-binding protein
MQVNMRRESRKPSQRNYSISWQEEGGLTHSVQVRGSDVSNSGIGIRCPIEIRKGTIVYIQAEEGYPTGYSVVRHVTRRGTSYIVGLELDEATRKARPTLDDHDASNYYEFLQISPNAQAETIQRVYHFLAARYHPDNPETGDPERFILLNRAYEALSHPERRACYDATLKDHEAQPSALFQSVDFLDGVEGELNRRLAVLALLYRKCRANIHSPQISLLDLETQMGFPREYLDFTLWYLRSKKYLQQENGAEFSLTCLGVDYVEDSYAKLPLLRKLLNAGTSSACDFGNEAGERVPTRSAQIGLLSSGETKPEELERVR